MNKVKITLISILLAITTIISGNIIKGKVFDKNNDALPGVKVTLIDSLNNVKLKTYTNFNGEYIIKYKQGNKVKVIYDYISYKQKMVCLVEHNDSTLLETL